MAPEGVAAFAIDAPRPGARSPGTGLEISGWAIGVAEPLIGVRAVSGLETDTVHPVNVQRPDVAADYGQYAYSGMSGFSFWVSLPRLEGSWSLTVEAMLANGSTAPLARIRGEVTIQPEIPAFGNRLTTAPDFVILGTQRGGTTSLHAYLSAHPMVVSATVKELHYLTDRFQRGRDWYLGQFPRQLAPGFITGEATPYALFHPLAPPRLRELAPEARLIVLLRDPVDRAFSHYRLECSRGDESLTFAEAIDAEHDRLSGEEARLVADPRYVSWVHNHWSYLRRGDYATQLDRWFGYFPPDRFLILRSEDLFENPETTLARVNSFLELPHATDMRFAALNRTRGPSLESSLRQRLVRHFAPMQARLAPLVGSNRLW